MNRRWLIRKTNSEFLEYLSRNASISPALAQILVNRGLKDTESIKAFLSPDIRNLHDPFLMPDMEKAVQRIRDASKNGERVLVHGDYDADGITSTALIVSALRMLGLETFYYIPNRFAEGYGLSREGINRAVTLGVRLIITVDCGISAEAEISLAASNGIDVIVTDHHEPPKRLPRALAIINPHRSRRLEQHLDSEYPFKYLAGVGVAFKLAQALVQDSRLEDFLALAAIGTIGDSVPLTGENRILVTHGLSVLNNGLSAPWVHSLREAAGVRDKEFRSGVLSYSIVPRINAAGRLGDAGEVVELFLTEDPGKAKGIASFLDAQNRMRQKIEEKVLKSALSMIGNDQPDSAIVLGSTEWNQGVIGIVASRLAEMFYRPTVLFSIRDGIAKGSARSIPSFHLYRGISDCAELLLAFGGHSQAAGLTLDVNNLQTFRDRISALVRKTLTKEDLHPTIEIDAGVELFEVDFNLVRDINLLEPFGNSNQKPLLGAKAIEVMNQRIVGKNHLKMRLRQRSITVDTIGFCMAGMLDTIESSRLVDIAFIPCINEWNGGKSLQLNLKAFRPSI